MKLQNGGAKNLNLVTGTAIPALGHGRRWMPARAAGFCPAGRLQHRRV